MILLTVSNARYLERSRYRGNPSKTLYVSLLDENGATRVDYGLIVVQIAIVAIVTVAALRELINSALIQVATVTGLTGG